MWFVDIGPTTNQNPGMLFPNNSQTWMFQGIFKEDSLVLLTTFYGVTQPAVNGRKKCFPKNCRSTKVGLA